MLAHVGDGITAPTAAANSGILAFAVISLGMGVLWVVNTLVSQNFGQKNYAHCGRYLWQGVWIALAYSILLLPLIPLISRLFVVFGHVPEMVAMERIYVHFVIVSAAFKLVQTAFSNFMLGTNRPRWVMISSVIAVTVNAIAAYIMVFGRFGVRPMGIYGAAGAQVIGGFVEMATLAYFALMNREQVAKFCALDWKPRLHELRTLVRVGVGSGIQFIVEIAAWSIFMNWVMGALGPHEMEAMAFMLRYLIVSFLPAVGISAAVTALVGRYIGMKRPDLALHRPINCSNVRNNSRQFAGEKAVDGDDKTYWATNDGGGRMTIEVDTEGPLDINTIAVEEADEFAGRVKEYKVEGQVASDWKILAQGTTIGSRKVDRFDKVNVWKVRLTIVKADSYPAIRKFAMYNASP